ncbi:hypothetical protein C8Q80DRAFT_1074345, partial [Daedaleopsis nitida]
DQVNLRNSVGIGAIIEEFRASLGDDPTEPAPAWLKSAKSFQPINYDGKDDNKSFMMWLHRLLTWFNYNRIRGPDLDQERIEITSFYVEGEAAKWYEKNVISVFRVSKQNLTFMEAIIALYRRFIITDSYQVAKEKWEKV